MNKIRKRFILLSALIVMAGVGNVAQAGKAHNIPKSNLSQSTAYTWYDGNTPRKVWLNPNLVAEFDPKPGDLAQTKALATTATRVKGKQHAMQLWQLEPDNSGKTVQQRLTQLAPGGRVSPVLHDGPSESGRKRALPGNIIVHLDPNWDPQQAQAWFKQHALEIDRPLNIGPNIFVVKTAPGLAALEKANEIFLSGEVVAAYPDWWQEVSKR